MVSHYLREAVEGRRRLELGVPPSANVGDVVEALLNLYPKLHQHVANERVNDPRQINVYWASAGRRGERFREGQRVYLMSFKPKRLGTPAGSRGSS